MDTKITVIDSYDEYAEDFSDTDLLFITDIFGTHKDKAIELARSAKSAGVLTVGIYSDTPDPRDMQRFRDVSDAVIKSSDPQNAIKGISDLLTKSGFVNLDFDDVKSVLQDTGTAFAGTGYGEGEDKCGDAARQAVSMCEGLSNAKAVLINITTDADTLLFEMSDAAAVVEEIAAPRASVIWGHVIYDNMQDSAVVTLIAGMCDKCRKI